MKKQLSLIETLEARIAPAGLVTVVFNKGDVTIVGDGGDNDVTLTQSGVGSYFLTANNGTMIAVEGKANTTFLGIDSIPGNLNIALGGGSDTFNLTDVNLPHNLTITDLLGDNTVNLGNASIGGKLAMKFGAGHDTVAGTPANFQVGGDLTFNGGAGFNDFEVQGKAWSVGGNFNYTGGSGVDTLRIQSETVSIGKNVSLQPGDGLAIMEFDSGKTVVIGGSVALKGSPLPTAHGDLSLGGTELVSVGKGVTYTGNGGADLLQIGGNDVEIHGAVTLSGGGGNKHISLSAAHGTISGALTVSGLKGSASLTANGGFTVLGKTTATGGAGGTFVDLEETMTLAGGLAISGLATAAGADVSVKILGTGNGISIGKALAVKYTGAAGNAGTFTFQNTLISGIASIVTGAGADTVNFDQIESQGAFTLDTGGSGDIVNIELTQQPKFSHFDKPTVLKLGAGDDQLHIGSANAGDGAGFLSSVASIFDGGLGVDTIAIQPNTAFLKPARLVGF